MQDNIKQYADALFQQSLIESGQTLREARVNFGAMMASRRMATPLPISGPEIQSLMKLFAEHVERCMEARFESYRRAYREAKQDPTDAEFKEIHENFRAVRESQARNSAQALAQFAGTHGNRLDLSFDVLPMTARGHDRVLGEWKVWREQINLAKSVTPDDEVFARMALEEAKRSVSEDGRVHPRVGVVVVKDGKVIATAHRGEFEAGHAEYIALERKLEHESVVGATVYTTLEPCTVRNHPKVPCAERLVERKVRRVVIGMLDPNPQIQGHGWRKLRAANIATGVFPEEVMAEVEELNRDFTRQFPFVKK